LDEEREQEALFYLEGPDERGCVWIHGASSTNPWTQNLGPRDKVAEVLSQWLGSIDYEEVSLSAKLPKKRFLENETERAERLAENSRVRKAAVRAADDEIDARVKRNIEEQGP